MRPFLVPVLLASFLLSGCTLDVHATVWVHNETEVDHDVVIRVFDASGRVLWDASVSVLQNETVEAGRLRIEPGDYNTTVDANGIHHEELAIFSFRDTDVWRIFITGDGINYKIPMGA